MLILFACLVLCKFCYGEYAVKCGENDGWSLEEAKDGVEGRYKMEWCTQQYYPVANWYWTLYIGENGDPDNCHQKYFNSHKFLKHSFNIEPIDIHLNCTQSVCLSTTLDLIFNGTCYKLQTNMRRKKANSSNTQSCCTRSYVQYVYNNYSKQYFTESEARVNVYPSGDHVAVDWFLGHIPSNVYVMDVCSVNETIEEKCSTLSGCATAGRRRTLIQCAVRPPGAEYRVRLRHAAPWCSGTALFERLVESVHRSNVQPSSKEVPLVSVGGAAAAWWGVALLAAGGALLAAALAWRPGLLRCVRKPIDKIWKERGATSSDHAAAGAAAAGAEGAGAAARGKVLLLYARDCAPLMDVARALADLLRAAGFTVYDVYSGAVCAAAARAAGEWARGALARPDVRVLLLQTPAARCLHQPALRDAATGMLHLEQPLLNRRVAYRRPHAGDALFTLALRLLTDNALTTQNYRKYYIATIESLEVELVAEVTPLQRYSLPGAAALLLRDLAAPGPAAPGVAAPAPGGPLRQLTESVWRLHAYIREKPDYLDDELIFFDYDT